MRVIIERSTNRTLLAIEIWQSVREAHPVTTRRTVPKMRLFCMVISFTLLVQPASTEDERIQIPAVIANKPQQFRDPDLFAATEGLKNSRRRERIVRSVQKATQRWQNKLEKQFKRINKNDFGYIRNKTSEIENATRNTMHSVRTLGERMVRNEDRTRTDMNHLTDKSKTMETRLERLEKLLEQRTQEDYYISGIENDYPNDAVGHSDVVEALERKLGNLEAYVREVWNVINQNYKQANLNKQTFVNMNNEISRLDNIIEEMKRETQKQRDNFDGSDFDGSV